MQSVRLVHLHLLTAPPIITALSGMKDLFALLALLASATPFLAQSPAATGARISRSHQSILDAIIAAGPVMILLFALSIFS